jgi:uncharacterized protein (TIGR00369 family)
VTRAPVDLAAIRRNWDANREKFVAFLDMRLESLEPGKAVMRLPFRAEMTNEFGAFHGGAIASLCDTAFYLALASVYGREEASVTSGLTCNFLAAARPPHDVIAHASVLKAGRRMVFGEVLVYSGERLVAHATLNFVNTNR